MVTIPDPDIRGLNVQIASLERDRASILLTSGRAALSDTLREYVEFVTGGQQDPVRERLLWDRVREAHDTCEGRLHMLLRCEQGLETQRLRALVETVSG